MKTEADKLRNSIQYGLGVMDSGSGEFKELSNKIDELFELSYLEGQSNPKIKQLEWVEYESLRGRKSYFAETPFTPYEVSDGGGYYVMFSPGKRLKFKSADEAKSAAQRDFEKRVKECLITK